MPLTKVAPWQEFPGLISAAGEPPSNKEYVEAQLGRYRDLNLDELVMSLVSTWQAVGHAPYSHLGYRLALNDGYIGADWESGGAWLLLVSRGDGLFADPVTRDMKLTQRWYTALAEYRVTGELGPMPPAAFYGQDEDLQDEWLVLIVAFGIPGNAAGPLGPGAPPVVQPADPMDDRIAELQKRLETAARCWKAGIGELAEQASRDGRLLPALYMDMSGALGA